MKHFDVVVIGAGSAGELISTTLARAGKEVALVEMSRVGGICAYLSCIPSKAILRSAQVRNLAKNLVAVGASPKEIELSGDIEAYNWASRRRDEIAENRDDSATAKGVIETGVHLFRGEATFINKEQLMVNDEKISWDDLVIATGSTPTIPEIEGLDSVDFWSSDDALSSDYAPRTIAILGGGPVACELAQIFSGFGSSVTIIELGSQIAGKEHPLVAQELAKSLQGQGVTILLNTEAVKVKATADNLVNLDLSSGEAIIAERLIVAIGRHSNTKNLNLEVIEVFPDSKGVLEVDDDCRIVGKEHIYAGGDVTGIAPFTHTANYQGKIITANILGDKAKANYKAIPRAIYTHPAVSSVGDVAVDMEGSNMELATFELSKISRTATDGEMGGILVLKADLSRGCLVGASAIGPHAEEWMAFATLAIRAEVNLSVLKDIVFAFPTYSQAFESPIQELAAKYEKIVIK
jgi:dihydrolipoamide dehydrogenase